MSAAAATALSCDTRLGEAWCPRRVILMGSPDIVRQLAAANGWHSDGEVDWCPDHAPGGPPAGGVW